jgi:hypothetical protein
MIVKVETMIVVDAVISETASVEFIPENMPNNFIPTHTRSQAILARNKRAKRLDAMAFKLKVLLLASESTISLIIQGFA